MANILTCAQLQTQVENDVTTWFPPVVQAALQVFAISPEFKKLLASGFVYSANYSGGMPAFTPTMAGAIAIDSITRRQWQWSGGVWT